MRSDCAARPAYAARWLVIVETQRDRARHARSGWPLRRRARAPVRFCLKRRLPPACSAHLCAPSAASRSTVALRSWSIVWESAFLRRIFKSTKCRTSRVQWAPRPSTRRVCARARDVVRDGIVQGYFLSTYSARKLGMQTTGNAGGAHQLALRSAHTRDKDDLRAMLKKLDTGLLLTEVMGQGVNYVTGDYSRGAVGFWVERGEIQYPVEGITVAGNLKQMFKDIVAVGADVYANSAKETGSVLIEKMTVAG